jgi:hypothetical protein
MVLKSMPVLAGRAMRREREGMGSFVREGGGMGG